MQHTNGNKGQQRMGLAMLLILAVIPQQHATANLIFEGNLVETPCSIRPGDELIPLDFGEVNSKYLYFNTRTRAEGFKLHLEGCDTSIGNTVSITFGGTPSTTIDGLFALDSGSVASGIAIGIETPDGKPLPIDEASDEYTLSDGDNVISLQAYVQGEPQAIADKTITPGAFMASSTFTLDYP